MNSCSGSSWHGRRSRSTAVGDGIAIPHVRNPVVLHVGRPAIALCFLERAIEYGALDGKPVRHAVHDHQPDHAGAPAPDVQAVFRAPRCGGPQRGRAAGVPAEICSARSGVRSDSLRRPTRGAPARSRLARHARVRR